MPTSNEKDDLTGLLAAWSGGDAEAHRELLPLVYDDLRKLARRAVAGERGDHALEATALVHEAYLRLLDQRPRWRNRAHFFAITARLMRRVLVDHARRKLAAKRGGDLEKVPFDESRDVTERGAAVLALEEALTALERFQPRCARVVKLRYFAGATIDETAAALGVSTVTVERDWRAARAWLYRELVG